MGKKSEKEISVHVRDVFPTTEEQVLKLIPDVAWAIARASAATVLADRVLTVAEYEAIAESATSLEALSSYPGLMSYLVLEALEESPELRKALKELHKATKGLPSETRQAVFDATVGVRVAQGEKARSMHSQWAKALNAEWAPTESTGENSSHQPSSTFIEAGQAQLLNTWKRLAELKVTGENRIGAQARAMAEAFGDSDLQSAITDWEESSGPEKDDVLKAALEAAADRALEASTAQLKTKQDLEQQHDLAERFLTTTDALIDQVQSRLFSIEKRLRLQNDMFSEDKDAFVENSLESLELSMTNQMKGRYDWASTEFWEEFKQQTAYDELTSRLAPVRKRYERIFDQWNDELEAFSKESATIRSSVLNSVDMRAFSALVPSKRSTASFRCALDRVSDTTLGLSLLGALAVGAATVTGVVQVAAVVAAVANPVGATVGAAVGAAALWNVASNREARKEKQIKGKRAQFKTALERLLKDEGLNHEDMANEVLTRFVNVAIEQYTPMIVEARLWVMKARLEKTITQRVLRDTRAILDHPTPR